MLRKMYVYIPVLVLPILAMNLFVACSQSDPQEEVSQSGNQDLKSLSTKLDKPYLINDQGEVISEIPPIILQSIRENLQRESKLAEIRELESMYDLETGKLRNIAKLGEIQARLDRLASGIKLPNPKGVTP
jgi:hypothetical protein